LISFRNIDGQAQIHNYAFILQEYIMKDVYTHANAAWRIWVGYSWHEKRVLVWLKREIATTGHTLHPRGTRKEYHGPTHVRTVTLRNPRILVTGTKAASYVLFKRCAGVFMLDCQFEYFILVEKSFEI
jgi:hypothetical protein